MIRRYIPEKYDMDDILEILRNVLGADVVYDLKGRHISVHATPTAGQAAAMRAAVLSLTTPTNIEE